MIRFQPVLKTLQNQKKCIKLQLSSTSTQNKHF